VLLFVNLNNDKENEYVSDGMIEEIINNATSSGSGAGGQPRETSAEKSVPDGIRTRGRPTYPTGGIEAEKSDFSSENFDPSTACALCGHPRPPQLGTPNTERDHRSFGGGAAGRQVDRVDASSAELVTIRRK